MSKSPDSSCQTSWPLKMRPCPKTWALITEERIPKPHCLERLDTVLRLLLSCWATGTDRMRQFIFWNVFVFFMHQLYECLMYPVACLQRFNSTLCLLSGIWCCVDWFWVPTIWRTLFLPPAGWSVWNVHTYIPVHTASCQNTEFLDYMGLDLRGSWFQSQSGNRCSCAVKWRQKLCSGVMHSQGNHTVAREMSCNYCGVRNCWGCVNGVLNLWTRVGTM